MTQLSNVHIGERIQLTAQVLALGNSKVQMNTQWYVRTHEGEDNLTGLSKKRRGAITIFIHSDITTYVVLDESRTFRDLETIVLNKTRVVLAEDVNGFRKGETAIIVTINNVTDQVFLRRPKSIQLISVRQDTKIQ